MAYPSGGTLSGLAIRSGRPVMIGDVQLDAAYVVHLADEVSVGPVMADSRSRLRWSVPLERGSPDVR
jgi:hypothetical protein